MKTKIVYVLVSDSTDYYLQQALVSIYSLKQFNPNAHICVVVDTTTYDTLQGDRDGIKKYASEIKVVKCPPQYNKQKCSRQLKTTLRNIIDGDYLFIDTDTIITGDLSTIDNINIQLGAVKDKHISLRMHPMKSYIVNWANTVGWSIDSDDISYFNSGVFYVKDTPLTRNFYKTWNSLWVDGMKKGINLDQPSLGKTNSVQSLKIQEINGIWNCQITDNGLKFLSDAKIIHYFASMQPWDTPDEISYKFRDKNIYEKLKQNHNIFDDKIIHQINNAKSEFQERCIILSGRNIELLDTKIFHGIRFLYFNHNSTFKFINNVIGKVCKLFN